MPLTTTFTLPAELVVLPTALIVVAIVAYRARLQSTGTILARVAFTAYAAGVVAVTLFPLDLELGLPFDISDPNLSGLVPDLDANPAGLALNVLLFLPLGVLLPQVARIGTWRAVALTGFLTSLAIELLQFLHSAFLGGHRAFDTNDLIANTVGALVGFALYRVAVTRRAAFSRTTSGRALAGRGPAA